MIAISLWGGADVATTAEVVDRVKAAADEGFDRIWFPQTASLDALTALAVAGDRVPGIRIGTAVVPIQGRHPIPLAQQALTVADAAGPGRFTLGVGVTHGVVSETWYGIPYRGIVDVCREELQVLAALLSPSRKADLVGDHLTARFTLGMATPRPGLVLAALGPRMLELAGSLCDGTVTWMTGPVALGRDIVPRISAAAAGAGRSAPEVVVGLPVCATDDIADVRARTRPAMAGAATMPSYRRMVAAEGVDDPVDLALIGDEDALGERLGQLERAGATELMANVVGTPEERTRTRAFLASRA
jgi:5,10-methylenetetrahydromethanopterin reductase